MSQRNSVDDSSSTSTITDQVAIQLDELLQKYAQSRPADCTSLDDDLVRQYPEMADQLLPLMNIVDGLSAICSDRGSGPSAAKKFSDFVVPEQLGDFRIMREIGRGGMGIVYEACQVSLNRRVALKILPRKSIHSREIERFRREAKIAASLHHSNLIPIFSYGENEGYYYFAMQLIQGHSLGDLAKGKVCLSRPMTAHWIAEIGVQAAEALDYAHHQQTLHRDIKPSNLLMDQNERVWISDFGVACAFPQDSDELIGQSGTVLYQAPERFDGQCDIRSEVYSLGATLCALAGIIHPSRQSVQKKSDTTSASEKPSTNSAQTPLRLPADLAAILLKSTEPNPDHRYQAASEMAMDLQRFLENRRVKARKASWISCFVKWIRRNPSLATAVLVIAVLMSLTTGIFFFGQLKFRALNRELVKANEVLVKHNRSLTRASFAVDAFVRSAMSRVETSEIDDDVEVLAGIPKKRFWTKERKPSFTFTGLLERVTNPKLRLLELSSEELENDGLLAISASQRLGNVMYSLGHLNEAKAAASYSLDLIKQAEASPSGQKNALLLLKAQVLNDLADIEENRMDFDLADHFQNRALHVLKQVEELQDLDQFTQELGRVHYGLSFRLRDRYSALRLMEQVLQHEGVSIQLPLFQSEQLASRHRTQLRKYLIAETYNSENHAANLLLSGQCLLERSMDQNAPPLDRERDYKLSIYFLQKAIVASQWNPRYVYHFSRGLVSAPLFGWNNGEFESDIAAPCLELAYKLLRRLVRDTQESPELLATLGECHFKLGVLLSLSNKDQKAVRHFRSSVKTLNLILEGAHQKSYGDLSIRKTIYLIASAQANQKIGENELARKQIQQASETLQQVSGTDGEEVRRQLQLVLSNSEQPATTGDSLSIRSK